MSNPWVVLAVTIGLIAEPGATFTTPLNINTEGKQISLLHMAGALEDCVIEGLSFGDENLIAVLEALGAGFNPTELRSVKADQDVAREYTMTRAWAWGAERSG